MKTTKQSAKIKRQHSAGSRVRNGGLSRVEPEVKQRAYDRGRRDGFIQGVHQSSAFIASLKQCGSITEVRSKVNLYEAAMVQKQMER